MYRPVVTTPRPPLLLCTARDEIVARVAALDLPYRVERVERSEVADRLAPGAAVLVDLPLAGTPNPGFLAALRCDARLVDVPILALVDEEDDATVRDAMGAGADDFVRASLLERELLVRLAAQRRAWELRTELRRRENDLRTLVELTRSFAGALDAGTLLQDVTRRLAAELGLRRCSIVLTDPRGERGLVLATSDDDAIERRPIDLFKYPEIREALRTGRAVVVEDAERHPLLDPVKDAVSAAGMGTMAVLPLALEEEILGVLFLRASAAEAGRSFSVRELDFAAAVANATAVALRNARSVAVIRSRVEQVEAHASALQQYAEIYEHVSDGIALVDAAQGIIRSANPAALAILGLGEEQVVGRRGGELLQGVEELYAELVRKAAGGEVIRSAPLVARRVDGAEIHVEVGAAALDEKLLVLSIRDVTEKRRMEAELSAARQELEAAQRRAMIVELAGAAAHELNQPLTSVLGYAELLQRKLDPDAPGSRFVGIIVREAERMAEVVRKIGNITRHETKEYVGNARIVDLERAGEDQPS